MEFIDVLEFSAEMVSISGWVFEKACQDAKCWVGEAAHDFRLNVSLSGMMPKQPEMIERTERILDWVGFDPARLGLEITEHAVIDVGLEDAATKLNQLRDHGIDWRQA